METRTIQPVRTIKQRIVVGGNRCDYLNQKRIEKTVEQHDEKLRKKYRSL